MRCHPFQQHDDHHYNHHHDLNCYFQIFNYDQMHFLRNMIAIIENDNQMGGTYTGDIYWWIGNCEQDITFQLIFMIINKSILIIKTLQSETKAWRIMRRKGHGSGHQVWLLWQKSSKTEEEKQRKRNVFRSLLEIKLYQAWLVTSLGGMRIMESPPQV